MWARIEHYMLATGKTWAEVAEVLEVSTAAMSMWKTGKRNVSRKALFKLEAAEREAGLTREPERAPPAPIEDRADAAPTTEDFQSLELLKEMVPDIGTFARESSNHWKNANEKFQSLEDSVDALAENFQSLEDRMERIEQLLLRALAEIKDPHDKE